MLADQIGPEKIMWATDYPHTDGFPDSVARIRAIGMPPEPERKVLAERSIRYYRMGGPKDLLAPARDYAST